MADSGKLVGIIDEVRSKPTSGSRKLYENIENVWKLEEILGLKKCCF